MASATSAPAAKKNNSMPTNDYRLRDGTAVPGVTTVLGSSLGWKSSGLMWWAYRLGKEGKSLQDERNKAADAGTLAHACAEAIVTSRPMPDIPEEHRAAVYGSVKAFRSWRDESKIELSVSELPLVSEEHGFGGCLDAVGVMDGDAVLVDFKSSKDLYGDHVAQVAGYSLLWDESHPEMPLRGWHVLRWSPDGGFAHHSLSQSQISSGKRVFLAALTIYRERKSILGRT